VGYRPKGISKTVCAVHIESLPMCIRVSNYQEKLLNAHEHYVLLCTMTTMSYHAQ